MLLTCVVDEVKLQAEDAVPFECCGLICEDGTLVPCENTAKDRTQHFYIAPAELRKASRGRSIVGVYHSHVGASAYVSHMDRAGMTFNGLYLVAATGKDGACKEVKAWHHKDGKFTPVTIPGKRPSHE